MPPPPVSIPASRASSVGTRHRFSLICYLRLNTLLSYMQQVFTANTCCRWLSITAVWLQPILAVGGWVIPQSDYSQYLLSVAEHYRSPITANTCCRWLSNTAVRLLFVKKRTSLLLTIELVLYCVLHWSVHLINFIKVLLDNHWYRVVLPII